MKVLYICLVLLPLVISSKSQLKLQLLARLLETLNRRDNGYARHDTRAFDDTTSGTIGLITIPVLDTSSSEQVSTDNPFTTPNSLESTSDTTQQSTSFMSYSSGTTADSLYSTPDNDVNTPGDVISTPGNDISVTDNAISTSGNDISVTDNAISTPGNDFSVTDNAITTPEADTGKLPKLPPVDKDSKPLTPEHYIRHVTEGMCVMLSYVKGIEKMNQKLGIVDLRPSMGGRRRPKEGHRPSSDDRKPENDDHRPDMDNEDNGDDFPWKKAENILQQLCDLLDNYNAEPMKLAEAFVEKMAEHKTAKNGRN